MKFRRTRYTDVISNFIYTMNDKHFIRGQMQQLFYYTLAKEDIGSHK